VNKPAHYALDNCIKCSICTTRCPVARVSERFAGPKQNGPDLERFRLQGLAAAHPSIDYCSNCKNCDLACPSGVEISAMNCRAKGESVSAQGASPRDRLLALPELAGKAGCAARRLFNLAARLKPLRGLGEKLIGINAEMTLPAFAPKTFNKLYYASRPAPLDRKAVYFPGCHVNYHKPLVGMSLVRVLERNGIQVIPGNFQCCGLPLISAGMLSQAQKLARNNLDKVQKYLDRGYPVITSCPSCSLALRKEYRDLFEMDADGGIGSRVYDIFEYLGEMDHKGDLDTNFQRLPVRAGYHQPCHLKAAGCGSPSLEILRIIPGFQVTDLDAGCCGLAGSYGFKKEKYRISMEIGREVFCAVDAAGVSQIITECGMCGLQISHGTGAEVLHPVQVLDLAYGNGHRVPK